MIYYNHCSLTSSYWNLKSEVAFQLQLYNLEVIIMFEKDDQSLRGLALMYIFKGPSKAVFNCSPFNETILVFVDDFKDDFLQPISQDFRDEFQATVKQSDWSVVIRSFRGRRFWGSE